MISRWLKLCFLGVLLSAPRTLWPQSFPDSFDPILRESAGRYMSAYDWRWWKAQCYQESRLDPRAVSSAGAVGLCQIMPGTWAEQSAIMGIAASPYNARANSLVGAAYMRRMLRVWYAERPADDRLRWAQASYNAGPGRVLAAQRAAAGSTQWAQVAGNVPRETREYVRRIARWYLAL